MYGFESSLLSLKESVWQDVLVIEQDLLLLIGNEHVHTQTTHALNRDIFWPFPPNFCSNWKTGKNLKEYFMKKGREKEEKRRKKL